MSNLEELVRRLVDETYEAWEEWRVEMGSEVCPYRKKCVDCRRYCILLSEECSYKICPLKLEKGEVV